MVLPCRNPSIIYMYTYIQDIYRYSYIYIFQMNLNKTLSEKTWGFVSYSLKTWGFLNNSRFQFETSLLNPFIFHPYETHMGIHANTTNSASRYPVGKPRFSVSRKNPSLFQKVLVDEGIFYPMFMYLKHPSSVSLQFNRAHREHRLPSTSRRPERKAWRRWLVPAWAGMDSWLYRKWLANHEHWLDSLSQSH